MLKKNQEFEGIVEKVKFPDKGIVIVDGIRVELKGTIVGQKVLGRVNKKRRNKCQGRLLEVLEKAHNEVDPFCQYFGPEKCGGCALQNLSHADQLIRKENQVKELFEEANITGHIWKDIKASPETYAYRNKMEFSFGDEYKEGPLALGMHKKGGRFDIITVDGCHIVDSDFSKILRHVLDYCTQAGLTFYHKMSHIGYLRYLVVRKSKTTGEILINLVTSTQVPYNWSEMVEQLVNLELLGKISGFIHTTSDNVADAVKPEGVELLFGKDFITEEILGLKFKISPYSFFQTNTLGSEVLYNTVIEMARDIDKKTVFDLYSGTGTIAQIMSSAAKEVYGIEIVEEAVEAAVENAKLNELDNCHFIAGDVLKKIDELKGKPDLIILDPPREGIHPKAIGKIIDFGAPEIVYVSCKPSSLVRDLQVMIEGGYVVKEVQCVDMFVHTHHVETVVRIEWNSVDTKGSGL
ncbi:MAG TPA: 23S rRNA (uracil(1939)-C(5))-methyltransferase RlmD [Epulopiscium sp.]|nr:23S rRNA (uracil(1939)-C(5))-methyltransferase RlmD [Candidatus Epulonipiscium sp.]